MLKTIITFVLIILTIFLIAPSVLALDIGTGSGNNPLNTITGQAGYKTVQGDTFIDTFIGEIITLVLGFVGALFLGIIVFAGFQWMSAGGNEEMVGKAKKKVTSSVIGLGIVTLAFVISNAVFSFFYVQSSRTVVETPEQNWLGNECDENSDCPPEAPICAGDLLWKWCTCTEASCQQLTPPLHCYEPGLATNYCSECGSDEDCRTWTGSGAVCDGGICEYPCDGYAQNGKLLDCVDDQAACSILSGTINNAFTCSSSKVCCEF